MTYNTQKTFFCFLFFEKKAVQLFIYSFYHLIKYMHRFRCTKKSYHINDSKIADIVIITDRIMINNILNQN